MARLELPDGMHWFETVVLPRLGTEETSPAAVLLASAPEPRALRALKSRCKGIASGGSRDDELGALCGYLLCVAAFSRVGPIEEFSSRSADELSSAFLELAAVMAAPWRDLLTSAVPGSEPSRLVSAPPSAVQSRLLIDKARNGDDGALGELLQHYQGYLLQVARRRLSSGLRQCIDSMDVVQGANMVALRKLRDLDVGDRASLLAWLARVVENQIRDAADYHHAEMRDYRKRVPLAPPRADDSSPGWDPAADDTRPSERFEREEGRAAMESALERLTAEEREVLRLRAEGRSFAEIACTIRRPTPHAAEAFHSRSRKKLADLLRAWRRI